MAFNARDFLAAHQPWAFTDARGRRHEARDLGHHEVVRWFGRFEAAGEDPVAQEAVASRFMRRLFPFRWGRYGGTAALLLAVLAGVSTGARAGLPAWWLFAALLAGAVAVVFLPREPDPWIEFCRLPGPAQMEVFADFFARAGLTIRAPRTRSMPSNASSASSSGTRSRSPLSVA